MVAGVTALLLSCSPSNFVPRSLYNLVSVGVVLRSQCIVLVLVLTDFVPRSIRSSVSIKKDYLGSSTVQASDRDVRSVVVRSIDRSVGVRVRLTGIRVARSVDEIVRSERGYRSARASP